MTLHECRILLVDDEAALLYMVGNLLKKEGYQCVDMAVDCSSAIQLTRENEYQLVLLDVMLPDGDGFALFEQIKKIKGSGLPVIFLSARDEDQARLRGLELGADDYITKPFKLAVFLSRIHALLRRSENFRQTDAELASNGITLCLRKGEGYKNGEPLELTSGEYRLLCLFMENPDAVLSSEQILADLWDCNENFIDNKTLTVYIRRLRMKIEDNPGEPKKIVTVRGMGYKWNTAG